MMDNAQLIKGISKKYDYGNILITANRYKISFQQAMKLRESCKVCKFNYLPAEIHHINNGNDKLIGLCPSCHSIAHHYNFTFKQLKEFNKEMIKCQEKDGKK